VLDSTDAERYPATLGGDTIYCLSWEDAEGINQAGHLLDQTQATSYPRPVIEYLAWLLRSYGRHRASRTLEERYLGVSA
jgi:hypothetical protein